ncbi:MAG: hypothetical protein D6831_03555 [Aquificota bacterium]|nr:MAG: hypothetical protein D6831_03555 [Aquificota bacterium]
MEKNEKELLEEIKKEIEDLRKEMVKVEHLEEYAQSSNFPSLIAVIILQLFTLFLLGWIMYKGGFGF